MARIIMLVCAMSAFLIASAETFSFRFNSTPLPKAIQRIMENHPDIDINFIYNELENYKTSSTVNADNVYDALRQTIGLNPVTVVKAKNTYYVEALQHGKYIYTGRAMGTGNEPVVAATVMLLAPKDSTVLTYGIADEEGCFRIPCDRTNVIAKLSCIGYKTTYHPCNAFNVGTITMQENAVKLSEIKVEAENAHLYSDRSVYLPTPRQKNVAADAVALLSQMAIPQLDIDPTNKSVKTISGQSVAIYIDYVSASQQDLSGMKTTDVKKIEYLLYPKDPRFHGADYVVNFIMQKYEYGGYTKVNASKKFGINKTAASIYSKFTYKDMTFDVYADESYLTDRHSGIASTERFLFPDLYGFGEKSIERKSTPITSRFRNNENNVTFRALYTAEKAQISNTISFNNTSTPRNDNETAVSYSDAILQSTITKTIASNHNMSLNYKNETYLGFNDNVGMYIEAVYEYGNNESKSNYNQTEISIVNNAKEHSHCGRFTPSLVWNLNEHNSLMPYLHGEYTTYSLDYYGSSPSKQEYDVWGFVGGLKYKYTQEKWSAGTQFGWTYANTNLTGTKIRDNYPMGNVFATFSPNRHNQFEVRYAFAKKVPETYQKSPNMLQQDELMWYTGTPGLKNIWNNYVQAVYTLIPNNRWQIAATGRIFMADDRVVTRYLPIGPNGTMLRQYVNNGSFRSSSIGMKGTAKFFDGNLVVTLRPEMWLRRTTGEYALTHNELTCVAQLTWYFGNFYLYGWYVTPSTYPYEESGIKERTPSRYQMELGYGKGPWRASATAYNFLRSSWESSRETLSSQYYGFDRNIYSPELHMSFQISVSYTFGYGKKVHRGDEVGGAGTGSSAILK
ncbi:MAG: hypothetical protein HFJ95_01345 [Muribaculaceae bacterium]|mgnify:CR=1 FL=1|nr:hypothetical protein [Muribaculaceae bacterium]